MTPPRVRFAPSPTGFLHVGSARTALFNWIYARSVGGRMLLRIEDTDEARNQPEMVDLIYDLLSWLGIDWDEEPVFQSERRERHREAVESLLECGAAYLCDADNRPVAGTALRPGLAARFRMPAGRTVTFTDVVRGEVSFASDDLEDFVVWRSAGTATFLLANAVDDVDMGVTHAIRGEDLLSGVPKVILLLEALGVEPPVYAHLPLLVNAARKKLSKRRDDVSLGDYRAPEEWSDRASSETSQYHAYIDKIAAPEAVTATGRASDDSADDQADLPTYAQVVGVVDRLADESTYVLAAAGGFPGELVNGWRGKTVHSFDCEYGYSCMGYEISGGWGAKMALPDREVVVMVGDGSYLMMNSDLYSTVLTGHKLIVIVCDNGGYAVINRLQLAQGGVPFNNLFADSRVQQVTPVDFAAHAASMGCESETVTSIAELEAAFQRAQASDRTYVIALNTHAYRWTEGGSFWEVGVPEVSASSDVRAARAAMDAGKDAQRVGW